MNGKSIKQAKDRDLKSSMAALQRAALRARRIARDTGTRLIFVEDGAVHRVAVAKPQRAAAGTR